MWQKMSREAREIILQSQKIAKELHEDDVTSYHLFLSMGRAPGTHGEKLLAKLHLNVKQLQGAALRAAPPKSNGMGRANGLSEDLRQLIDAAFDEAKMLGSRSVGTEHLVLGWLVNSAKTSPRILTDLGVSVEQARKAAGEKR